MELSAWYLAPLHEIEAQPYGGQLRHLPRMVNAKAAGA